MPEITSAGYAWLRARCYERWRHLGVFSVDGKELCRLDTQTDPRIARDLNDATGEIEIECRLSGADPELSAILPVRIGSTALFPTATGGDHRSRVTISPAAIIDPTDGIILVHRCHIPLSLLSEALS